MVTEAVIWAIFLLPLGSFAFAALVVRPFFNRYSLISGLVTIAALGTALGFSIWTLRSVILGHELVFEPIEWLEVGGATIEFGLLIDPLTAVMLIVVTSVSLLVQIYSLGYMKGDPSFSRYYAYMSLFTAAMLGLVISSNIIQLYMFWELVGVSSYLLIGFWHERPAAAAAAKKAFIITRIGDVGFLIAILYLFTQADNFAAAGLNAFHIPDIWEAARPEAAAGAILGGAVLTWLALGIFAGAAGKSGQFPLHTWLPDAMEGPTPVSALIHAATMVAAGVFLVARFFPVFEHSPDAMTVVALVGAFTAIFAASMGLVMNDIKRVMAYSTVSQLGYMMAALGLGLYAPAIFHLVTHAAFKALLFLGAGSVNHATGTFDMRYMGGLRKVMPITYILMVVASLSLVGIIPLAGFWSKDEILLGAWNGTGLVGTWVSRVTFSALLAGAKQYSQMDRAEYQSANVHELLYSTVKTIFGDKVGKDKPVELVWEKDTSLPELLCYPGDLNQVWTNIIDNAIQAMDGHGTLTIRTRRENEDMIRVEIGDTGPGISEDNIERIFTPFFTTKPFGEGTGLGLDLAWQIVVKKHLGNLSVQSKPGDTTFIVCLPLQAPAPDAPMTAGEGV